MNRLKSKLIRPPGGWRYVDPDTNFAFDSKDYDSLSSLLTHISAYRVENKLEVPKDLRFQVENWLCGQPDMKRYCFDVPPLKRTASQYIRGAKAAAKMLSRGKAALVEQDVAEKRAKTCLNCPYNKLSEDDSKARLYTDKMVHRLIGSPRKTPSDDKLFSCEICSCNLRAKVHISQKIVEDSLSDEEVARLPCGTPGLNGEPLYCWQIKPVQESESKEPNADS